MPWLPLLAPTHITTQAFFSLDSRPRTQGVWWPIIQLPGIWQASSLRVPRSPKCLFSTQDGLCKVHGRCNYFELKVIVATLWIQQMATRTNLHNLDNVFRVTTSSSSISEHHQSKSFSQFDAFSKSIILGQTLSPDEQNLKIWWIWVVPAFTLSIDITLSWSSPYHRLRVTTQVNATIHSVSLAILSKRDCLHPVHPNVKHC